MPVVGRNRKAKPLAVWQACALPDIYGSFISALPKPHPSESFSKYITRLDWREEAIFHAVIAVGCTKDGKNEPNQRDFLLSLDMMAEALRKIRFALHDIWEK